MAEDYQNDGKCPRCGKRVRQRRVSMPDLDSPLTETLTVTECSDQQLCGWPG